jgi:hypothetical protein
MHIRRYSLITLAGSYHHVFQVETNSVRPYARRASDFSHLQQNIIQYKASRSLRRRWLSSFVLLHCSTSLFSFLPLLNVCRRRQPHVFRQVFNSSLFSPKSLFSGTDSKAALRHRKGNDFSCLLNFTAILLPCEGFTT